MSKLGLVIVMMLMAGRTNAQNYPDPGNEPPTYFVLIQSDDGQAFYVRLNNQLYSSSPEGHLILSQLRDSVFTITVGFPGQSFPEQRFLLGIFGKDRAFRLSRQDNRWELNDGQGQSLSTVVDSSTAQRTLLASLKRDDAFSQMMAAIVRDTAVMYSTYIDESPDTVQPPATASAKQPPSSTTADSPVQVGVPLSATADPAAPSSPTGVVKLSEHKSTQSLSLVFADYPADKKTDTIDVVIPVDSPAVSPNPSQTRDTGQSAASPGVTGRPRISNAIRHPRLSDTSRTGTAQHSRGTDSAQHRKVAGSVQHQRVTDTAHSTAALQLQPPSDSAHSTTTLHHSQSPDTLHSGTPVPGHQAKNDTPALASSTSHKPVLPFVNSDCHAFATDYDVDKLRIRMLAANKDDDRIQTAYKIFKTKCFASNQVRALSEVFANDAAKFKFLATAYPFVSDDHFPELVNLLSDPVYAGKFRTMTDHQ